jgi:hypothetical protein
MSSPAIKATLALSPYCQPFTTSGHLGGMAIPVMYQGGTRDIGITPAVKKPGGCFSQTSAPAYFVEFTGAGHLAWSDLQDAQHDLITEYALAVFDHVPDRSEWIRPESRCHLCRATCISRAAIIADEEIYAVISAPLHRVSGRRRPRRHRARGQSPSAAAVGIASRIRRPWRQVVARNLSRGRRRRLFHPDVSCRRACVVAPVVIGAM